MKEQHTAGETAIQKFSYEGSTVTFAKGNSVMVNATQMAKKFGKLPADFLKLQQTKEFLSSLSDMKKIISADLVQVRKGGTNQGTWMHEDVAIEFARWLSPKFAIWCNDRIKELAKDGVAVASADESPEQIMARALKVADDTMRRQQATIEEQHDLIKQQDGVISEQNDQLRRLIPLEGYIHTALGSGTTYTMTEVAQFVGYARVADFLDWCVRIGVLYRLNGRWMPTPDYLGKGYFTTRVYRRMANAVCIEESYYTVVTEAGRLMLYRKMEEWTDPNLDRRIEAQAAAHNLTLIEEGGAL